MSQLFCNEKEKVHPFRYRLTRTWGSGPKVLWIMLNPSTATEYEDDPTIRRCVGLSQRMVEYCAEEYGGLEVVNLYAFRATDPKQLKAVNYPIEGNGDDNDNVIRTMAKLCAVVIAGWGANAPHDRVRKIWNMMADIKPLQCFGYCACGCPRHPLMLPGNSRFVEWRGLPEDR
jgi:hypothetical protein